MPKILACIPALINDLHLETIESIQNQTVPVTEILLLSKRGVGDSFPSKISDVLNSGLANIHLANYDYLLRVDADTILPIDFLESNLKLNVDVVGYGYAHLIKISAFLKYLGGEFNSYSDDSYLNFKVASEGGTWHNWDSKPILIRKPGQTHGKKYFFDRGKIMWLNGYEPLHVLGSIRWDRRNVYAILGYFAFLVKRVKRLDCAKYVFHQQVNKLKVIKL